MYNRYIPQPDGSYSRRQYQDTPAPTPRQESPAREEHWQPEPQINEPIQIPPNPQPVPTPAPQPRQRRTNGQCRQRQPQRPAPPPRQEYREPIPEYRNPRQETNVLGFLKQLLPKDFDTGDLLIVLLLLLMSGDCQEDQNTALLTLVLYLFL